MQPPPSSSPSASASQPGDVLDPAAASALRGERPDPDAPIGRRERRKLEVRARIYAAARELFAKQGVEATTIDEIAERADVAPATFFNHFQSKQTLLALMAGEVFEYLHALTQEHLESADRGTEKLRRFIASATEGIESSRGVARDVLLEFMRNDATPDGPHPYLSRLIDPFVRLIREGQSTGEFRLDHEPAFLAQMTVGMLNSAITNWLADPAYPIETGLIEAAEFALDTLAPPASPLGGDEPGLPEHDDAPPLGASNEDPPQ